MSDLLVYLEPVRETFLDFVASCSNIELHNISGVGRFFSHLNGVD